MKTGYIELCGEKHPLCFSLSATEEIIEQFGDMGSMTDALTSGTTAEQLRAIDKVLDILMRAGRRRCAAERIEMPENPLPCRPADVIGLDEANGIIGKIFDTITDDAARTVEAGPPKDGAGPDRA